MGGLDDVRGELVDLWGRLAPLWGVTPAAGRVFGWLLASSDAIDADGLCEGLGMSRGAVSMACRELADWGLVHGERPPGTRRVSYRPVTDLERAARSIVATRKRREWDPMLQHLQEWIPRLKGERSAEAKVLRERLSDLEGLVRTLDGLALKLLEGGIVPKLGLKLLVSQAKRKGSAPGGK
ncbi:MAG: MarR family transcriptional regulator [Planctomycetes bacterium]|nr:MarR family transcriptional regulator [Planctomycetota bacterium]